MRAYLLAIGLALGANVRSENFFQQLIARNSATSNDLFAISARKDLAVAVGARGTIVTSNNGVQWVNRASGTVANLYAVAVAANQLCAVGANGTVVVSKDGETWTQVQSGTANDLRSVTILNSTIVAVGAKGTILVSNEGATFQNKSLPFAAELHAVDSGDNASTHFAAVGEVGTLLTSEDGVTWTERDTGTFENLTRVEVTPAAIDYIGSGGTYGRYVNGQPTLLTVPISGGLLAFEIGESGEGLKVLDTAGTIWRGLVPPDATKQSLIPFSHANAPLNDLTSFRGATIAVGDGGHVLSTPVWFERANPSSAPISSIIYAQGNFVALAGDDTVLLSSDGQGWAAHPFGLPTETHKKPFSTGIVFGNGVYLTARGNEHFPPYELLFSTNAIDWALVPGFPNDQYITGLGFTPGEFLASAHSSIYRGADVYEDTEFFQHSPNGKTWIGERGPFRFTDEKLFQGISFARASDARIYSSSNAVNWVAGPSGGEFLTVAETNLFSGALITQDGQNWRPHNIFAATPSTNDIDKLRVAGRTGTYVATMDTEVGTLAGNGTSPIGAKWAPLFDVGQGAQGAHVTGLVFAENSFVVTTSSGQIFQSESIPVTVLIQQDGPTSLLLTTTADSLQLESTESLTNPIWKAAGTLTAAAPLKVPIGNSTQLFFRAAR